MNRRTELLMAAADALESGENPLSGGFLSEHDVTSDECLALADQLAIGARVVARGLSSPRSPQGMAVLLSMATDVQSE